jgi:ribokinase
MPMTKMATLTNGSMPRGRRDTLAAVRAAVVGHVEWVQFLRVERMPAPGDILHVSDSWEEPAGGGPGAAVQLAKLAGSCDFFTALGEDELGHRALEELEARGITVHAAWRTEPQRRAVTFIDGQGERSISIIGARLNPARADALPWGELSGVDALYFTAGDDDALREARRARTVVCTTRILEQLRRVGVRFDAVVGSDTDESERYETGDIDPVPNLAVLTRGREGGRYSVDGGAWRTFPAPPVPGPILDTYGAGDSFAAGLTYGLAAFGDRERAIEIASRCGAAVLTGRGPFEGQLRSA